MLPVGKHRSRNRFEVDFMALTSQQPCSQYLLILEVLLIVFFSDLPVGVDTMQEQAVPLLAAALPNELGTVFVGSVAGIHAVAVVEEVV